LPRAYPQPDPPILPVAQLFDREGRLLAVVDVHTYLWLLDHDSDVEPGIPVRRRNDWFLVLPWLVLAEHLPGVLRVGDVLNGVGLSLLALSSEVEWPKKDRVVGPCVHHSEGDAQKVALEGATLPESIELDDPIRELDSVENDDRVLLRLNLESGLP